MARNQKKAKTEHRTLLFLDEAGFFLTPSLVKTWAPQGQTPVIRAPLRYPHLSVVSALTYDGRLFMHIHHHTIKTPEVIAFLRHLLLRVPGKLLLIWDGGPIHAGQALDAFLALDTSERLIVMKFPPYAPEVDPDEYVWRQLKYTDLVNLTSYSLDQLHLRLRAATVRLRARVTLLRNMIRRAGLKLSYACVAL